MNLPGKGEESALAKRREKAKERDKHRSISDRIVDVLKVASRKLISLRGLEPSMSSSVSEEEDGRWKMEGGSVSGRVDASRRGVTHFLALR